MPRWYSGAFSEIYQALVRLVPQFPSNLHLLPLYKTDFTMFEPGLNQLSLIAFIIFPVICSMGCCFNSFFPLSDGRHFKSVYGKDFVDSLINGADMLSAEREKSSDDQLATQRNQSTSLQGQINLLRSHQVRQEQRINFALAREAEEADGRSNNRSVLIDSFLLGFLRTCFLLVWTFVNFILFSVSVG